jgi:hypothetical protein
MSGARAPWLLLKAKAAVGGGLTGPDHQIYFAAAASTHTDHLLPRSPLAIRDKMHNGLIS